MSEEVYLLANQPSELERLRLQSRVWEPPGRHPFRSSGTDPADKPWTSAAEPWAGSGSSASGSALRPGRRHRHRRQPARCRSFILYEAEGISNVELVVDDLFESKLEPQSFDLIHARYQIAPLDAAVSRSPRYRRSVRPGGPLVLEEWDLSSWHFNPAAPAAERLIRLFSEIFAALGGEAGRGLPELLREIGSRSQRSTRTSSRSNQATPICVCRFSSVSRSSRRCLRH